MDSRHVSQGSGLVGWAGEGGGEAGVAVGDEGSGALDGWESWVEKE